MTTYTSPISTAQKSVPATRYSPATQIAWTKHLKIHSIVVETPNKQSNSNMSLDDDAESIMRISNTWAEDRVVPYQVYTASTAETSAAATCRRPTEYPCTVTMPDGTTTLTITAEMAEKVSKVIESCTMLPANATPEEVLTLQYFQWQESIRLKNYRAVLKERKNRPAYRVLGEEHCL